MGHNSQPGQLGFGIQTVKGTPVAATRFARLRSGGLGGDRSLLIPDPEIGGNRDIQNAYLGPVGFMGDLEFYPRMEMIAVLLRGAFGAVASSTTGADTSEQQTVTITGTPTGGTFTLTFDGETTAPIAYNASSATVVAALIALPNIGPGEVTGTGGALPGTPVVVTFAGGLATLNVPQMTASATGLTGGTTPAVAVTTTTPGTSLIGTHVITPANDIPWISVEERVGESFESFRYTDAKVNTLHLEAEASGFLMGSANLLALRGVSDFTEQVSPDYDESPLMVGTSVIVTFDGNNLKAKNFSLDFTNNIENDDFRLGQTYMEDAVPKRRELKMSASYRPEDSVMWKQAMWGSSSLSEAASGPAYRGPATITITSYETIGNVAAGTPFSLALSIPELVIAPYKITPSGDDIIGTDIEMTAIRPSNTVPLVTATVVNGLATAT